MELRVPVLRGPLRGWWWLPASGGKTLRFLLGSYEADQVRKFRERVPPGSVVWDVGAHVGYYTLLGSALVGPAGTVLAFEPNPVNLRYLRAHVRINRCRNVAIVPAAVSDHAGVGAFERAGTGRGRLASAGTVQVEITTLDAEAAARNAAPDVIKMDIEGEECRALSGAVSVLERDRPVILLSTHGPEAYDGCAEVLRPFGYELSPIGGADREGSMELLCVPG